jgi:anion-transporting  ArsA/GET3 family ATPase
LSAPAVTDLRFVVVSGKGGVGRTTVAATLARVASAAGKRVLLAAAAATDRLGRMFGRDEPLGPAITTLAPGIDGVNITPASSIHEYGVKVLRSELVTRALF